MLPRVLIGRRSELFSRNQRQLIATYCKKRHVERRAVIAEIIEGGMKAKGISQN